MLLCQPKVGSKQLVESLKSFEVEMTMALGTVLESLDSRVPVGSLHLTRLLDLSHLMLTQTFERSIWLTQISTKMI